MATLLAGPTELTVLGRSSVRRRGRALHGCEDRPLQEVQQGKWERGEGGRGGRGEGEGTREEGRGPAGR